MSRTFIKKHLIYLIIILSNILLNVKTFSQGIYINELMASNDDVIADNQGKFSDWIELYNSTNTPFDLAGLYITDEFTNRTKHHFPATANQLVIPAKGYLLLWASGNVSAGNNHLSFSLSASGEQLALVSSNGTTIIDSLSFGAQKADISYGRQSDGGMPLVFFKPSSPNASNILQNGYIGFTKSPVFSNQSGFYAASFPLSITSSETNTKIYYTFDGSEPDSSNINGTTYQYHNSYPQNPGDPDTTAAISATYKSFLYQNPLTIVDKSDSTNFYSNISSTCDFTPTYFPSNPVYKGTIVKAKVYKSGYLPSEVLSKTYFFTPDGQKKYTLPIVSLQSSPDKLFDYNNGIYVAGKDFVDSRNANPLLPWYNLAGNYHRRTNDEISTNIEIFKNGLSVFIQNIGSKIHGGFSRFLPNKSFQILGDSKYGNSSMNYQFFPNSFNTNYKTLILRRIGGSTPYTFRDEAAQKISQGLKVEVQNSYPVISFLNGEYWGILDFRDRYDEDYYSRVYSLNPDNIEYYTNNLPIEGQSGNYELTKNFIFNNNMKLQQNYDYTKNLIDVENFVDYSIIESFFGNFDWPQNNTTYWRNKTSFNSNASNNKADGRWRWSIFDIDNSFYLSTPPIFTPFANLYESVYGESSGYSYFFKYLIVNDSFKNSFFNRYADLLNTYFLPTRMNGIINEIKNTLSPEMNEHIARWKSPGSYSEWEASVNELVNFSNLRPAEVISYFNSFYGISGEYNLTVNVNNTQQGYVKVNTIDILSTTPGISENPYPWTGKYFNDVVIEIRAKAKAGYRFKQWLYSDSLVTDSLLVAAKDSLLTVSPSFNRTYKAVFEAGTTITTDTLLAYDISARCGYKFSSWSPAQAARIYPASMKFVYMNNSDPKLTAQITGTTTGLYNLTSKTRITALDTLGISFINTGSDNTGYPSTKLGGALLALNTIGQTKVTVQWTGGTVTPNSKQYAIRLQYRIGSSGTFIDLLDSAGHVIEYARNSVIGRSQVFPPTSLPASLLNKTYIQLFWRYYYTNVQNNPSESTRDELRLDDIIIKTERNITLTEAINTNKVYYNYKTINASNRILNAANVEYYGNNVLLSPGFVTETGIIFNAYPIGCIN